MTSYFQDGDHDVILLKPLARPPRVGLLYELRYLIHSTYNRTCLWTKRFFTRENFAQLWGGLRSIAWQTFGWQIFWRLRIYERATKV